MSETEKKLVGHWSGSFQYSILTDDDVFESLVRNTITFSEDKTFVDEYFVSIGDHNICSFSIKGKWEAGDDRIYMRYNLKSFETISRNDNIKESILKSVRSSFLHDFKLADAGADILLLSDDELVLGDDSRNNPTYKHVGNKKELEETKLVAENSEAGKLVESLIDGDYYFGGVVGNVATRMRISVFEVVVDSRVEGQCQYASPADKIFTLSGTFRDGTMEIYEFYGGESMSNNTGAFKGELYRLKDGSLVMRGNLDCIDDGKTTRVLQFELKGKMIV